jgi:hypothetical protein
MKKKFLKQIKPFDFLLLFGAFLYGNLFAINYSRMNWGFLLIFCVVFFLEFLNQIIYFFSQKSDVQLPKHSLQTKESPNWKALSKIFQIWDQHLDYTCLVTNTVKRGFLLGFFVEAFKVGS